ncbi:MAG: 50S ribosomal protein L17 [candidate division WOR-3 bacterium]|nr:MAG: 50S ribosomal protein L17 [candidate division WOR-3 bacterium]
MRHGKRVKKLGRKKEHRHALLKNLCRSLFMYEKIKTTLPKAKETRRLAEHLIQFAKKNDLAAKRMIYRYIPDHKLVKIICDEIGPRFAERNGGYTRIYRLGPRLGDGAEMAVLELVELSDPDTITQRRKLIQRRKFVAKPSKKEKPKKAQKEKPKEKKAKKDKSDKTKKKKLKTTKREKKTVKKRAKKEKKRARAKKAKKTQKTRKKRK